MTVYNCSGGPAVLPAPVLEQAKAELTDWHGSGMSVMEMSHRGKEFISIAEKAEQDLRELMNIPANYRVLFLQGGASQQFAMVPLNLLRGKSSADYLNTGEWSKKAIAEAKRFCTVNVVATGAERHFSDVPDPTTWTLNPEAAYLHLTPNETIGGVEFSWVPEAGQVPIVADLSSTILSRPIDVSRYGLIYAGAQKNMGIAGLAVVIVRDDLLGGAVAGTPAMLDYKTHADNESMYNTPPAFALYMAGLVFEWIKAQGGLVAMEAINKDKADALYSAIDRSAGFYRSPVPSPFRSRMNVPFTLKDAALDGPFLKQADALGLLQLKGHRSVGGMRASIYNAMPRTGVDSLINFMNEFARQHG